jgi:hypothetical protein
LPPQGLANGARISELDPGQAARLFGFYSTGNVLGSFVSQIGVDFRL